MKNVFKHTGRSAYVSQCGRFIVAKADDGWHFTDTAQTPPTVAVCRSCGSAMRQARLTLQTELAWAMHRQGRS